MARDGLRLHLVRSAHPHVFFSAIAVFAISTCLLMLCFTTGQHPKGPLNLVLSEANPCCLVCVEKPVSWIPSIHHDLTTRSGVLLTGCSWREAVRLETPALASMHAFCFKRTFPLLVSALVFLHTCPLAPAWGCVPHFLPWAEHA